MDEEILEQQEELTAPEAEEILAPAAEEHPVEEVSPAEAVEAPQGDHRREIEDFLDTFPDVKGEDIPPQVWEQAAEGMELTKAYALYENRMLKEELAALRQNRENDRKSLGSLGSSQMARGGSSIEDYWDAVGN